MSSHLLVIVCTGDQLPAVGRTPMREFLASSAFVMVRDGEEIYFGMRRSLYFFLDDVPVMTANKLGGLTSEVVHALADLAFADSEQAAAQALAKLDAPDPLESDPQQALKQFGRYAFVSIGPRARQAWRQSSAKSAAPANHCVGCCWWCTPFAVRGACEHLYLALHVAKIQCFDVLFPVRHRKKGRSQAVRARGAVEDKDQEAGASPSSAALNMGASVAVLEDASRERDSSIH